MTTQSADFAAYDPLFMKDNVFFLYTQKGGPKTPKEAHEYFLRESEKIICWITDRIITEKQKGGNLQALFNEVISHTSQFRAEIAKQQGSPNLDKAGFGVRRDSRMEIASGSPTEQIYGLIGEKLFNFFGPYINTKEDAPSVVLRDECDGRISTVVISLLDSSEFDPKSMYKTQDPELQMDIDWMRNQDIYNCDPEVQLKIKEIKKRYQQTDPSSYSKISQFLGMIDIYRQAGFSKVSEDFSDFFYFHGLLETEWEGQRCELTRYMMGWNKKNDRFISPFVLLHQNSLFLQDTLDEIGAFFARAISWDRHSIEQLKDIMAHFCYLSAHNMRDFRGTAAQTEWITHAIFRSLNLVYIEDKSTMVDLEAFANPLFSDFRTRYHKIVQLHPIVKKSKEWGIIGGCVI